MSEWIVAYDDDGNEEVHDGLVRCKDCVFFSGNDKLCAYDIRTVEEGYCFLGESREAQRNFNASNTLDALEKKRKEVLKNDCSN